MKHLPDSRKRKSWFVQIDSYTGERTVLEGWHQDGIRMAVRRATPTRWHTGLERAEESRTSTGHGFGEVSLAALPGGLTLHRM